MTPARNAEMSASKTNHRRDVRYQVRFPAQLAAGRRRLTLMTEDVSRRGVFLRTSAPLPLRELVRIQLVLPPGQLALRGHGMVVHVVQPGSEARVPGVGIQLYAWDRETQLVWDQLLAQVQRCCPESADQARLDVPVDSTALLATPAPRSSVSGVTGVRPSPAAKQTKVVRHASVLLYEARCVDDLRAFHAREVSRGSARIPTAQDVAVGADVLIHVRHPDTDESYLIDGVVSRKDGDAAVVQLVQMDRHALREFQEFVNR